MRRFIRTVGLRAGFITSAWVLWALEMKRQKAKDRLHKATTEALESKIDILEMDLKEKFQIWIMIHEFIMVLIFFRKLNFSKASFNGTKWRRIFSFLRWWNYRSPKGRSCESSGTILSATVVRRYWWHCDVGDIGSTLMLKDVVDKREKRGSPTSVTNIPSAIFQYK